MKPIHLFLLTIWLMIFGISAVSLSRVFNYEPASIKSNTLEQLPEAKYISTNNPVRQIQLRHFVINRGKMDEFLDAWLKGVYPLRIKSGFKIERAWVVRERNEFIWILSYEGPENFESKDSAYYASAGRTTLNPDPAQYIARSEKYFINQVIPKE